MGVSISEGCSLTIWDLPSHILNLITQCLDFKWNQVSHEQVTKYTLAPCVIRIRGEHPLEKEQGKCHNCPSIGQSPGGPRTTVYSLDSPSGSPSTASLISHILLGVMSVQENMK